MISHGLMQTEAQTISFRDHRRLTLDLARPGVNTHHDSCQGKRVPAFHSMPPVASKLNELWLQFLYLSNGNDVACSRLPETLIPTIPPNPILTAQRCGLFTPPFSETCPNSYFRKCGFLRKGAVITKRLFSYEEIVPFLPPESPGSIFCLWSPSHLV